MQPLAFDKTPSESTLQDHLIKELIYDDYYCIRTHGNAYQSGFPDVFVASVRFGTRWIEMKKPGSERFTSAQLWAFTQFARCKVGVWVLTGYDRFQRNKLMGPSNWSSFLHKTRGITLKPIERIEKTGPEGIIQNNLYRRLTENGWFVLETYGSLYQSGLPDMYACHPDHGVRWIELKNPAGYKFTAQQIKVFPCMAAYQVGIWVLTGYSDTDINLLFGPPNWFHFMWK